MAFLPINENDPIYEKHIAWFTKGYGTSEIMLYQLVERTYNNPSMLGQMKVTSNEVIYIGVRKRIDPQASTWILMEENQISINKEKFPNANCNMSKL